MLPRIPVLRFPAPFRRLEHATLVRHSAVLLAVVTAYALYRGSTVEWQILWIIAGVAGLNFVFFLAAGSGNSRLDRIARVLSVGMGLACWAGLMHATGGADSSPFVAGLWLEIVLSAMTFALRGIAAVTALALLFLWLASLGDARGPLIAQSILLATTGVATGLLHFRWRRNEQIFVNRVAEQGQELQKMQCELEDTRHLRSISEGNARLGHGLKNATHSLRGFARLIEPGIASSPESQAALGGLRRSIDRLENLARTSLHSGESTASVPGVLNAHNLERALQDIVHDVARCHPAIQCSTSFEASCGSIPISREELDDVVGNLVINAIESMKGRGRLTVETRGDREQLEIRVSDNGAGIAPDVMSELFRPGSSTKRGGSGLGLYLVRKLVEKHGGRVAALPTNGVGACVRVVFPNRH